jgi:hypothetical protein
VCGFCCCWDLLAIGHGYGMRIIYSLGGDAGNNEQIGNADEASLFLLLSKNFVHVHNNLYSILLTNIWK